MKKTYIAETLEINDCKDRYDAEAKRVLSDKTILAWIMQYTMEEFRTFSIAAIRNCIEGTPEVSTVPVRPGVTPEAITGMPKEGASANEGEVFYDIRFHAITPDEESVKIIINMEAQKDYVPGRYDLVTRGIFYDARMLSAQYGTEFTPPYYNDLKKVYSVWICMNAPQYAAYTITKYHMAQKELYGHLGKKPRYDLMEVITVCLGNENDLAAGNALHGMLSTLFSTKLNPKEKETILERDYDIETSVEMEGGFRLMCNLSLGIEEEATKRGLAKGIAEGLERGMAEGLEKGMEVGLTALVQSLMGFVDNFDDLYAIVIKNDAYKTVTKEEVLKYYS